MHGASLHPRCSQTFKALKILDMLKGFVFGIIGLSAGSMTVTRIWSQAGPAVNSSNDHTRS